MKAEQVAKQILADEYSDYKKNSWHYDRQYIMIIKAIKMYECLNSNDKTPIMQVKEAFEPIQRTICADCGAKGGNEATHDCHKSFEPKSIFTRRKERNNKTYDFVVKHKILIYQNTRHYGNFTAGKNDNQLQELITLARKEIGYSDRTWSGDIFTSIVNMYKKICV